MTAPARVLPWDSEFFGRRIARVDHPVGSGDGAQALKRWAHAERVDCVYVLVDAADLETPRAMTSLGAHLVDVRVTLATESLGTTGADPAVRAAEKADLPALEDIAASAHRDSRFYADPRFPRARVDELYRVWIRKAVEGADGVVTFEHGGGAAGYVTFAVSERDGAGEIGLVAIAEHARGHGAGTALLGGALDGLARRGARRVRVVTQGRNLAAQRMYQKRGFRTERMELWYHLWPDPT